MRLSIVARGNNWWERLKIRLVERIDPGMPIDAFRAGVYRSGFFSGYYTKQLHRALRGKSPWSVAEREFFAAFVSSRNQCVY